VAVYRATRSSVGGLHGSQKGGNNTNVDHIYKSSAAAGDQCNSAGSSFGDQPTGHGISYKGFHRSGHCSAEHKHRWLPRRLSISLQSLAFGRERVWLRPQRATILLGCERIESAGECAHQATGGLVINLPTPRFLRASAYVLAEGGALVFDPTNNRLGSVSGAQRQTTGVFADGAGADFPILRQVSLRAEYRRLVYSAPNFGLRNLNTNATTHTAQPSAGVVFRF